MIVARSPLLLDIDGFCEHCRLVKSTAEIDMKSDALVISWCF